jgi:hypothetical protein
MNDLAALQAENRQLRNVNVFLWSELTRQMSVERVAQLRAQVLALYQGAAEERKA